MVISFPCERCGKQFEVDGALAGKKCKCKQCGHVFAIPVPRRPSSPPKDLQTFGASDGPRTSTASRPAPPRPASSAPRRPATAPAPVHDPYEDVGPRSIPTAELDEDEGFLPPRPVKPVPEKKKKAKRRSSGLSMENIPGWAYLVLGLSFLVAIVIACTSQAGMALVGGGAVIVGLIMMAVGGIGLVVVAFQEGLVCGLMYLFVPFYSLYYLFSRWEDTKRFFLLSFGGWLMVVALAIFMPAVQAARNAADRARGAGGPVAEVETIIGDLIGANNELADLLATVNTLPDAERAAPEYNQLRDRVDELDRRMKALPPLGAFDNQRLGLQYNLRLNQSTERVLGQNQRLAMIPGVFPALQQSRQAHLAANPAPIPAGAPALSGTSPPDLGTARPEAGRPPEVDLVEQALADLAGADPHRLKVALGRLSRAPVNAERRVEVAEAILPRLQDPDGWTRGDAARALVVWGGPESVPALIEALKDPDFAVRWAVLDALKALKDSQAAGPVAALVIENRDRAKAVAALKAIGPPAEPAVLPLVTNGDLWVRREACAILKEIGTEASVPTLKSLAMRNSGLDSMAAVEALNAMSLRNVNMNPRRANAGDNPFKKKSPFRKRAG